MTVFTRIAIILLIGVLFVGLAGLVNFIVAAREKNTGDNSANVISSAPVPPIDSAAPARTETATFALG